MMNLEDAIRTCIALDADILEQDQREADAAELVRMHLVLAQALKETSEEKVHALAISDELRQQHTFS